MPKNLILKDQSGSDDEYELSEQAFVYYVNNGVFGSFNWILYDLAHVKSLLQNRPRPDVRYYSASVLGPTCDGLDHIVESCDLPERHVGDWMLFEQVGVHTVAAASALDGYQRPAGCYKM